MDIKTGKYLLGSSLALYFMPPNRTPKFVGLSDIKMKTSTKFVKRLSQRKGQVATMTIIGMVA